MLSPKGAPRVDGRTALIGLTTAALGAALLVWLVARVGVDTIATGARQVGWGFAAILAISGIRILARAFAWTRCLDPAYTLPLRDAFAAGLCAETIGSLTPLGPLAGEPARAAFASRRVPLGPALAAVAAENLFYSLSAAVMIAAGMTALVVGFTLPENLRRASAVSIGATLALAAAMVAALWLAARRAAVLAAIAERIAGPARAERLRALERRAHAALNLGSGRLAGVVAGEALFHLAGVAEVHVTLWLLLGGAPPLLTSFVLEAVNRVINVIFRFVPIRLGVDEAGTALVTRIIGLGAAPGVTLALVRKARVLVWSGLGAILMLRRGYDLGPSGRTAS
jgi:Lysylphosphatidylglycerol synthase TM region